MSLSYYTFDPRLISWQWDAVKKVYNADYEQGTHEFGFCGIVGSAKTTLCAWLTLDHVCKYKDAVAFIGRRSFQDLKETSYAELKELIYNTWGPETESWCYDSTCSINFPWGSEIKGGTWGDGRFEKYKSKQYSWAWLEEPTENSPEEYKGFLSIFRPRVGRLSYKNSDVKENAILYSFNAHDPEHPIYDDFYTNPVDGITHLIESKERDNPFLHPKYYENLLKRLDPINVKRQIFGLWVSSTSGNIYHAYDPNLSYRDYNYKINPLYPVHLTWDFNIGDNKPLSMTCFQYIKDQYHFFDEVVIEGIRTEASCEELSNRGYFNHDLDFIIHGDASGSHRDTRSKLSDYMVIKDFLTKHKNRPRFTFQVPKANPAIRKRHNEVNAYMQNGLGEVRLFVYKKCKNLHKGFKLTSFKKNSSIEDDSKPYQHVTTAAGYGICSTTINKKQRKATTRTR